MLIEEILYDNCEIILIVIIFIAGIVTLIQKQNTKKAAEERRTEERKNEECELKSYIDPLKADIRNIVNAKIQQLSVRTCPQCGSTGVNLLRTDPTYHSFMRTTGGWYSEDYEYIDSSGEKWPATRSEYVESEKYDYSSFTYRVKIICQRCGFVHFFDIIDYQDKAYDYDKKQKFTTYKHEEVISVNAFLADIYPIATTYEKNLNAYNQLLDHLRNLWK